MMRRRKACLVVAWVESSKQDVLNFRVQDIESTPIKPTVEVN